MPQAKPASQNDTGGGAQPTLASNKDENENADSNKNTNKGAKEEQEDNHREEKNAAIPKKAKGGPDVQQYRARDHKRVPDYKGISTCRLLLNINLS